MPSPRLRHAVAAAALVGAFAGVRPVPTAAAYEYAARARTLTQVYQLRGYRLVGDDVWVPRRRFAQSISLVIWDVGDLAKQRARARLARSGPTVSWHSHLRLDHDFGAFAAGRIADPAGADGTADALDAIPELADDTLALTLSYGYLQIDGLLRDRLALRIGRMVSIDADDLRVTDGMEAAIRIARPLELVASGGLAARDASPLAASGVELDGTSGADCQEYVEAAEAGRGRWRLIDRSVVVSGSPLSSDRALCPQRAQLLPTASLALRTARVGGLQGAIGYRRTQSRTVGVLDRVDRLDFPDLGLYPNEAGQAPAWGVNEEAVSASVDGLWRGRGGSVAPRAWLRRNLVSARFDRAGLAVTMRRGAHRLEPEVGYVVPSFDADSIFAVFAVAPATDARLSWSWQPGLGGADERARPGGLRAHATAWSRRYDDREAPGWAYGLAAGGGRLAGALDIDVTALADAGLGGERVGTQASVSWRRPAMVVRGALGGWRIAPDELAAGEQAATLAYSAQVAASFRLGPMAALHLTGDVSGDRYTTVSLRTLAVLDLAFAPEM
jgi:hypothetical protein